MAPSSADHHALSLLTSSPGDANFWSGSGGGGGQRAARNSRSHHTGHEWRAPSPPSHHHHASSWSRRSMAPPARPGSRVAQLLNQMDMTGRKQQMLRGLESLNDQPPHYGDLAGFAAPGAPPSLIDGCIPETELGSGEGRITVVRDLEATGDFPRRGSPSPTPTRRVNASHGVSASASTSPLKSTPLGTPRAASPKRAPSPGAAVGSNSARGRSPYHSAAKPPDERPAWISGGAPSPGAAVGSHSARGRSPHRSAAKPQDERPVWIPGGSPARAPPAIPARLSAAAAGTPSPRPRSPSPMRARSPTPTPGSSSAPHAMPHASQTLTP
jgi:hypothetical protein